MILYINACVRRESRTERLAKALLEKLGEYKEIKLTEENIRPLNTESLEKRTELGMLGKFDDPIFSYAREFAEASEIVIAAPYWDCMFPALLKTYLENIYVIGIVSEYDENGMPRGLCKAQKLHFVTTAGGKYNPKYSYEYIQKLTRYIFGVKETELYYAENLDIVGFDAEEIMNETLKKYGLE